MKRKKKIWKENEKAIRTRKKEKKGRGEWRRKQKYTGMGKQEESDVSSLRT